MSLKETFLLLIVLEKIAHPMACRASSRSTSFGQEAEIGRRGKPRVQPFGVFPWDRRDRLGKYLQTSLNNSNGLWGTGVALAVWYLAQDD